MSKFTTEVRYICETAAGLDESAEYTSLDTILTAASPNIFNFDFPIFDENYRLVLEKKILKHYYTREIGEETVGLWKLRLDSRLNEIMPFYNKLYESELLTFNPFYNVDYTKSGNREGTGNNSVVGTNTMNGTVKDEGLRTTTNSSNTASTDTSTNETTKTNTGNENTMERTNLTKERTGTETTTDTGTVGKTTILDTNTAHTGTDRVSEQDEKKNDHWDYYSDTPQGTIGSVPGGGQQALEGNTYLTNVRHITDDSTGSDKTSQTTHGHNIHDTGENNEDVVTDMTSTLTLATTETNTGLNEADKTLTSNEQQSASLSATKNVGTTENGVGTDTNTTTYNTTNGNTENKLAHNLEEYTEHVVGKTGRYSFSKALIEFRETFLNIDAMIIAQLNDLFMGLWE